MLLPRPVVESLWSPPPDAFSRDGKRLPKRCKTSLTPEHIRKRVTHRLDGKRFPLAWWNGHIELGRVGRDSLDSGTGFSTSSIWTTTSGGP